MYNNSLISHQILKTKLRLGDASKLCCFFFKHMHVTFHFMEQYTNMHRRQILDTIVTKLISPQEILNSVKKGQNSNSTDVSLFRGLH